MTCSNLRLAALATAMAVTLPGLIFASPLDHRAKMMQLAYVHSDKVDGSTQPVWTAGETGSAATQTDDDTPLKARIMSTGRIVKVDAGAGRITIEHRPIARLYMESMTMIFRVKDPVMLIALTPGDKIRFEVERDGGSFIVTRIEHSN